VHFVTKWGVTRMRQAVTFALALALVAANAAPAPAEGEGHGSVGDDTIDVDSKAATTGDLNGLCTLSSDPITLGTLTHLLGIDHAGVVRVDDFVCVPIEEPGHEPTPPPIPALPTIEEAWRAAHLSAPTVAVDPPRRGVTGLTTHISTGPSPRLTLAVRLGAYTMTGTANLVAHFLQIDDEQPRTFRGASSLDVAFETKGVHRIEIGAVWHAATAFSGPLLARPLTADIGTATITATRTYVVTEVRSVLQS